MPYGISGVELVKERELAGCGIGANRRDGSRMVHGDQAAPLLADWNPINPGINKLPQGLLIAGTEVEVSTQMPQSSVSGFEMTCMSPIGIRGSSHWSGLWTPIYYRMLAQADVIGGLVCYCE